MMSNNTKKTFQSSYDQHKDRIGQEFEIIHRIDTPDSTHDEECLPMYVIKFSDGKVIEAWPEEVGF